MSSLKDKIAIASLKSSMKTNVALYQAYKDTTKVVSDLTDHYSGVTLSSFYEKKVRFMLAAQTIFVAAEVREVLVEKQQCALVDVGDSDGSLQLMLKSMFTDNGALSTAGVNLQSEAVKRIQDRGLEGILIDAMDLHSRGLDYDIVTLLETLEHIPNPIGFLESIHDVVRERLVISVPFVRNSRVALNYLDNLDDERRPTIENVHIFELSPPDWRKIFRHCGWKVAKEWTAYQYKPRSLWHITAPIWRRKDFEGFWLASLKKDNSGRERYDVE